MQRQIKQTVLRRLQREGKNILRQSAVVHENTVCASCGEMPIVGTRYSCLVCKCFNLCEACEEEAEEKEEEHEHALLQLQRPSDALKVSAGSQHAQVRAPKEL